MVWLGFENQLLFDYIIFIIINNSFYISDILLSNYFKL